MKALALIAFGLLLAAMPMAMPVHSAADAGFNMAMARMQRSMGSAPMTGDSDHDFLVMMIPHHQGAVDMCRTELRYGSSARILALCRDIIASQSRQIQEMRRLLVR